MSNDSPSHGGQKNPVAMCRCDVYRWEHGDYSLAGDEGDPGMGRFSLEALLHFCPQGTLAVLVLVFLTDLTGTKCLLWSIYSHLYRYKSVVRCTIHGKVNVNVCVN